MPHDARECHSKLCVMKVMASFIDSVGQHTWKKEEENEFVFFSLFTLLYNVQKEKGLFEKNMSINLPF